jgi:hypothetical protein
MTKLPKTFVYVHQPYSTETLGDLRMGSYNGYPCLHGVVIEGSETSRLFQFTSTRDTKGTHRTVYGIKDHELAAGRAVRAYCG